ncbi:VOC family protein [Devosia rhodophyticola]|uniref:VOC family protein n=1 Tax=Devosia rhodophyticola TaxID=3026423 RepID=A0ABY7YVA0_9HYPH|nr:VOC family protein [Devosia rhodophyticola]WDR05176.1 VOC family protein [Devosia rhodophyticola]
MADPAAISGITPYLSINGARDAIDFYKKAFDAVERDVMLADDKTRIMHATIEINGAPIFLCDFFPEFGSAITMPQAFNLHIQVDDAQKWWDRAVAAGCTVSMKLEKQFWGDIYGQVKDPFGVSWAIDQADSK